MKFKMLFLSVLLSLSIVVKAQIVEDVSRFENVVDFKVRGIEKVEVVSYHTTDYSGGVTALFDENGEPVNHRWEQSYQNMDSSLLEVGNVSDFSQGVEKNLIDGDPFTTFTFSSEDSFTHNVAFKLDQKKRISGLKILLENNIIPPEKLTLRGKDLRTGKWLSILKDQKYFDILQFSPVEIKEFSLSFETKWPLSIKDIFILEPIKNGEGDRLIFFGEPQKNYTLFSHSHFGQEEIHTANYHPLKINFTTPKFILPELKANSKFNPDFDGDGIMDNEDLCPRIFDSLNKDNDKNGRGDLCEDPDGDGVISSIDNCPFFYNPQSQNDKTPNCSDGEKKSWPPIFYILGFMVIFIATGFGWFIKKNLKYLKRT